MFGWLNSDPIQKLEAEYSAKSEQARDLQRNGDIVGFAKITAEAADVLQQIKVLEAAKAN